MNAIHFVVLVYFAILFGIGLAAKKQVVGADDFYVAGKKQSFWVAAFSALATGQSAWLLLGLSGFGAMYGISAYWVMVGEAGCIALSWFFMGGRMKRFTNKHNSVTVPDYLSSRFQSKTHTLRILAAGVLSIFVLIYISSQIDATGKAFESFFKTDAWLDSILGNYYTGAAIGFGIVVLYCFGGGYIAACWTDVFQGIMMFFCLFILPFIIFFLYIDNTADIIPALRAMDPMFFNPFGPHGASIMGVFFVLSFLLIGLGHLGSPQVFIRFVSIRSEEEIQKGRPIAVLFTLGTEFAAVSIGILARYVFTANGAGDVAALGHGGENSLPMLVRHFLPEIIVGVYVAAVLSAIMSTISSLLVLASSAVTRDFYQRILHPEKTEQSLIGISRAFTMGMAVAAFLLAFTVAHYSESRTIFWFVIFSWSGIAASFCPLMILSLFWKKYTERAAIATMITGFLCIPFFAFVAPKLPIYGAYFASLSELPPSFAMALLVGYAVSKIWPQPELEKVFEDGFRR